MAGEVERTPALGTPEAAVQSCVKLMSMLFEQPEKYVAFYLDLYYQVRLAYERGKEPPPLRREDLIPAMREIWEELLAESEKRSFACAEDDKGAEDARGQDGTKADASGQESPEADGERRQDGPTPARRNDPRPEAPEGVEAVDVKPGFHKGAAAAAKEKRVIYERLTRARAAGVTVRQLERACRGQIMEGQILNVLACGREPVAVYRVINAALDAIEAGKGTS